MDDPGVDSAIDSDSHFLMTSLGSILRRILGWIPKMILEWILGRIF